MGCTTLSVPKPCVIDEEFGLFAHLHGLNGASDGVLTAVIFGTSAWKAVDLLLLTAAMLGLFLKGAGGTS